MATKVDEEEETVRTELPEASISISPFLEVSCRSSGKIRRFATGTEAGFALYLINQKLDPGLRQALHIEATKEGEEPVSFGPNSVLVSYGEGWKLQTVVQDDYEARRMQALAKQFATIIKSPSAYPEVPSGLRWNINFVYLGKIVLAFSFIFLLGGMLTVILENLPRIILFISSSLKYIG